MSDAFGGKKQKAGRENGLPRESGDPGGNRTHDTVIKSHVLYRLSYRITPAGDDARKEGRIYG